MAEPAIDRVLQISMVVDDLEAYVKRWNDEYGIGPWTLMEFNEHTLKAQRIEGKAQKWGMKMALCNALNIQLELIQPLYGDTTYMRFLQEHGPGLHHLAIEPAGGFPAWAERLRERGGPGFVLGGNEAGQRGERQFEYVDLRRELGTIFETYYDTGGFQPGTGTAAGTYPPREEGE